MSVDVYIKQSEMGCTILAIDVDDINAIGDQDEEVELACNLTNLERKGHGDTELCTGFRIEHNLRGKNLQKIYTTDKRFDMVDCKHVITPKTNGTLNKD